MQELNGKEYLRLDSREKAETVANVLKVLSVDDNIKFVYIFGSFINSISFRDIDIGIYLEHINNNVLTAYELSLSEKLAEVTNLPFDRFDIKILNNAPLYFLNNVFRQGKLLFSKSPQLLSDLIEASSLEAISNYEFSQQSLRDLVIAP